MKKTFWLIGFILLTMYNFALAEIIVLDSGEKIEANVIKKDDKVVVVDYKGAAISYFTFEVKSIDGEPLPPPKTTTSTQGTKDKSAEIAQMNVVSAEEYLKRGVTYYSRGNFDQAILDLNKALKVKPDFPEAYLNRGLAHINKGNTEQAFLDYNKAIELNPKYEEAYYVRGLAHAGRGEFDEAISDYGKAIETNPQYVQAYLNRGFVYVNKGVPEQAIADFNKVLKINASIPAVYYLRGVAYANKGNLAQAIADYSKAIELEPKYVEAYTNRALAYLFKGSLDQSKADPNSPKAFVNIGPTYNNKADVEHALSDCAKAIDINPKYAEGYIARARIYLAGGEYDKAWTDVHKAEELETKVNPQLLDELKRASGREK